MYCNSLAGIRADYPSLCNRRPIITIHYELITPGTPLFPSEL